MSLRNRVKIFHSLTFTFAFCVALSEQQSYASEAQNQTQNSPDFINIDSQINETDSMFKGIKELNGNLLQEAIPLEINMDSVCEIPKRKAINCFDFVDRNFYWLVGGFLSGSIAYRVIADPGFSECFLPNIVPYFVFAGSSCVGWYLSTKYGDEQNQRKQRERMDLLKKFQQQFIEGATDFMRSTDSPEKHSANPQND